MNYRQHVAALLRQLCDSGLTHRQIADRLGFPNPNVISMHLADKPNISPYPLKRLRALAEACRLDAMASLKLVARRAKFHPDNATELDMATVLWIVQITVAAVDLKRAVSHGSPAVCHV